MADFETIPLCLAKTPPPSDGGPDAAGGDAGVDECTQWSCEGCPADRVGRTFCQAGDLFGCLVSTHPRCGLKCEKVELKKCSRCSESNGVVTCEQNNIVPVDPCKDFPCAACPADDATFCQGLAVSTCLRVPVVDEKCAELCLPRELTTCPQACIAPAGEARCSP